ncbi:Serine protease, subtilisin family [Cognatiyoonia koreensis]|uniref:Serine protease, subtilisin family n=1 Tax=Cognatiyoonia koreensis TaxID=364200 RepID=A0A1I0PGC8_9RHOB|nr:S8 family peptidase [Cognatiyoonia koreensis]SEW13503.1 Serine protease, subtilisin family [Cognatiyoonia koreensis]
MPETHNVHPPRVILRMDDEIVTKTQKNPAKVLAEAHPARWRAFTNNYGEVRLTRSLQKIKPGKIREMQKIATARDPMYKPANFEAFFDVTVEKVENLEKMAEALRGWPGVRSVDIEIIGPDPLVNQGDDPRFPNQGYLAAAPNGINAPFAWALPGGDGAGQNWIDIERGWTLDHEDLVGNAPTLIHGNVRDGSRDHGTKVLGVVSAVDNTIGCVGIAPKINSVQVASYFGSTIPDAVLTAADALSFGDTMLLEIQTTAQFTPGGLPTYGPTEVIDLNFEAIRLASAMGIIVVAAGGNGTDNGGLPALNLDTYTKGGLQILNPASPDFRDSGAIIVAAATSAAPHTRMSWSTFGARIDCYGWGQNVNTTASNSSGATDLYSTSFGGTSSASPIVTGAALCVQGVYEAQNGFRLSPGQMRRILSDPTINTPPAATETTAMGVLPDLASILGGQLQLTPDVYLRDFVGDLGEPHTGSISASPDIIVRNAAVANPQAAFGEGSGTEMLNNLGHTVTSGQDNFIYVRAQNQGSAAATGASTAIFWSPVSTMLTPDLWNPVGTIPMPDIPTGEVLTCADALTWPAAQIPGEGHYCFIGLLDHPLDPAPVLADFEEWDNFRTFIRNNNNATWRNFNVVDVDPSSPSVDPMPFLVNGWLDRPLPMRVEMQVKMPRKAELLLELPLRFLRDMKADLNIVDVDQRKGLVLAKLPNSGRLLLGIGDIPAKERYQMKLSVKLPKGAKGRIGQVMVRQLFKGEEEVGRVTWSFQDAAIRKELDDKVAKRG